MKLRVGVDSVYACVTLDGAWTPELVETLLRQCADEVVRMCVALGPETDEGDTGTPP